MDIFKMSGDFCTLLGLNTNDKKVVIFGLCGVYTGVCSQQHMPSYKKNVDKDSVIFIAVNDPYIEFYRDFDGSFHKAFELKIPSSVPWSAYVVDGKVKFLI
ncbi:hypothetical protein UlMin_009359 [Ulmus minor]